jgi:hypothetical protein
MMGKNRNIPETINCLIPQVKWQVDHLQRRGLLPEYFACSSVPSTLVPTVRDFILVKHAYWCKSKLLIAVTLALPFSDQFNPREGDIFRLSLSEMNCNWNATKLERTKLEGQSQWMDRVNMNMFLKTGLKTYQKGFLIKLTALKTFY